MATTTRKARGFATRCLHCGEADTVRVDLSDVGSMTCSSCDAEMTAEDVREAIGAWQRVLAWLETAPAYERED